MIFVRKGEGEFLADRWMISVAEIRRGQLVCKMEKMEYDEGVGGERQVDEETEVIRRSDKEARSFDNHRFSSCRSLRGLTSLTWKGLRQLINEAATEDEDNEDAGHSHRRGRRTRAPSTPHTFTTRLYVYVCLCVRISVSGEKTKGERGDCGGW